MEGVAFSAKLSIEALQKSADVTVQSFKAAGGGMASDVWCQIRADVLGRPLRRLRNLDAGVLGAAILAGVGTGLFGSIAEAAGELVVTDRVFEPDMKHSSRYDYGFAKYRELYDRLADFNADLVAHGR